MGKFINLKGTRFGNVVAIDISHRQKGSVYWNCQCDCGNKIKVAGGTLRYRGNISCGCNKGKKISEKLSTHKESYGEGQTPEYRAWNSMKRRCYNPKAHAFHRYGGKGVSVCDKWLNSYENFLEDMGRRPSELHSLDRINGDRDYSKENCRWADKKEQARNTYRSINVIIEGESMRFADACEKYSIKGKIVRMRLSLGWELEKAFKAPVGTWGGQNRKVKI